MTKTHIVLTLGTCLIGLFLSSIYYYTGRYILRLTAPFFQPFNEKILLLKICLLTIFLQEISFAMLATEFVEKIGNNPLLNISIKLIFPALAVWFYWLNLRLIRPEEQKIKWCIVIFLSILPATLIMIIKLLAFAVL